MNINDLWRTAMAEIDQALADLKEAVGSTAVRVQQQVDDLRAQIATGNADHAQLTAAADAIEQQVSALSQIASAPPPAPSPEPVPPVGDPSGTQPGPPQGGTTTI